MTSQKKPGSESTGAAKTLWLMNVLATFPINLMKSQRKPGSQSTDAAKTLWLMNVVRKIHYAQIHMLLGNSNVKSLPIVVSPDCSDMNAYL